MHERVGIMKWLASELFGVCMLVKQHHDMTWVEIANLIKGITGTFTHATINPVNIDEVCRLVDAALHKET